jgi:hypothetical protein
LEAACSKHRRKDVLPLHPELVILLREWLAGLAPDELLFPKLARRRTWLMVKKDLERVKIPYENAEGIADFHAAGRHTHITELLRNGASLPETMKLARHADVKMTMRYAHIGIDDQSKAVGKLPGWQRIGSGTGVSGSLEPSPDVANSAADDTLQKRQNPGGDQGSDASSRSESPAVADDSEWRRRESNPRPVTFPRSHLRA